MGTSSFFFKFCIIFLGIFSSFHYNIIPIRGVDGQTENPLNSLDSDVVFELDLSDPPHENEKENEIGIGNEGVTTEFYTEEFSTLPPSDEDSDKLRSADTDTENQPQPPGSGSASDNDNDNSTTLPDLGSVPTLTSSFEKVEFVEHSESQFFQDQQMINVKNEQKLTRLKKILDAVLENYDKRIRPGYFDSGPTKVGVNVLVKNIASINEVDMQFQIDFYLRQTWRDSRLAFAYHRYKLKSLNRNSNSTGSSEQIKKSTNSTSWTGDDVEVLNLSSDFLQKIWVPDTFFRNEKSSVVHSTTVPNRYVRVYPDGQVKTSQRLTVTAQCVFNLRAYPMDIQVCGLNIGSYGYTTKSLEYGWLSTLTSTDAVKIDLHSTFLPQFRVKGHRRSQGLTVTSTGEYSSLSFEFLFVRSLDYYISRIYAPAFLVVTVSYFQLWMGRDANSLLARGRPGLGITSVLTITTIYLSNSANSARISYLKALDIYLGLCFLAVFGTLLQTCFVIYLNKKIAMWEKEKKKTDKKKQKKKRRLLHLKRKRKDSMNVINIPQTSDTEGENVDDVKNDQCKDKDENKDKDKNNGKEKRPPELFWPSRIDLISRILFPVIFFLLNVVYWTHFLNRDAGLEENGKWIFAEEPQRPS